ncbi:hypothetical protein SUGI_1080420 [Cryptomeria japonica]|uniref:ethylene-responsive transcription factor TINY-like n=1 Tax=Cryptomeria japonica TaxID=3369 RepID=UPI002414AA63|nr:ethylene-responsive transcription factor TINY-like [Cryptomeria japonica]GLJ50712.1 hypothetical protein SUGI_1080420 [Cryptomeria japonica]
MGKEGIGHSAERKATKHPIYIGVRKRKWGMWVSEIRVPNNNKRIWLGSFPTPEMAARAHDAAALALRGDSAKLNFPEFLHSLPHSPSLSGTDIQATAMQAAYSSSQQQSQLSSNNSHNDCMKPELLQQKPSAEDESTDIEIIYNIEMDEWLDLQNLLMNSEDDLLIDSIAEEQGEELISTWN